MPVLVGLLIALLLTASLPGPAEASSHLERQRRDAEQQLEGVERDLEEAFDELSEIEQRHEATSEELAAIEERIQAIQGRIAELEEELEAAREALAAAEEALAQTEQELDQSEEDLDVARDELAAQRELFAERVRGAYKRSGVSLAGAVLEAKDPGEATRAAQFVQSVMDRDMTQIETIGAFEARIEQAIIRLDELKEHRDAARRAAEQERDRVAALLEEQENLRAQADAEADERRSMLASLEQEEQRYEDLVASLESDSSKLESQLAEIAAEERRLEEQRQAEQRREEERQRQAAASRSSSSSGASAAAASSGGQLARPVDGAMTSPFGYRTHPVTGARRLHAGVDYGAPTGTPIRAAESGTVVTAGSMGGYGNTVVINHGGGMSTLYAHQSRLAVGNGQRVSRGEVIGYVGSTGMSTGPHLHFEVRINGTPTDPRPYL